MNRPTFVSAMSVCILMNALFFSSEAMDGSCHYSKLPSEFPFSCPWKPVEGGGMVQMVPMYLPEDSDFQVPEIVKRQTSCNLLCVMPASKAPKNCDSVTCKNDGYCHNYRPDRFGFYCFCGKYSCYGGEYCEKELPILESSPPPKNVVEIGLGEVYNLRLPLRRKSSGGCQENAGDISVWNIKSPAGTTLSLDILFYSSSTYTPEGYFVVLEGHDEPKTLMGGKFPNLQDYADAEKLVTINVSDDTSKMTKKYIYTSPRPGDNTTILYAGSGCIPFDRTGRASKHFPFSLNSRSNSVWVVVIGVPGNVFRKDIGFLAKLAVKNC